MKILSLTVNNYRTLQDISINFPKKYCTLSGKNNAGKSSVIRLLSSLFRKGNSFPWSDDDYNFDYKENKTQWVKQSDPIKIIYNLELSQDDDPTLISFIEKWVPNTTPTTIYNLEINYTITESDDFSINVNFNGQKSDDKGSKEIDKKIKDSNILFLYNSTTRHEEYYYSRSGRRPFYEFMMSEDERKELDEAGKSIDRRLRRLAREHKEGLNNMLGKLSEKYDVEFSTPEGFFSRRMPLGINLNDRNVEVPLNEWGSGTQNRTHILMSIFQANRIKTTESSDDKITPIVVIEEPESFLHPSAQAEFGRILRLLAGEFGIQIFSTTHSPYMLNQEEPESNILLSRKCKKRKFYETEIIDTSSDNWMAPFSDHLGIPSQEFKNWRQIFSSYKSKVLLVEGKIDKEYFEYLQEHHIGNCQLNAEIEVVPYGGKDAMKNTLLVQFVLSKFDQVFITYDLDVTDELKKYLNRLGLKEGADFIPLGVNKEGKQSIEGLLPDRILAAVNGKETDLVMRLHSRNNSERRSAKDELKRKYLVEFKSHTKYSSDELSNLLKIIKKINSYFSK